MCGLVGVFGDTVKADVDIFNDLLWMDALRGKDSTGIASVAGWNKEVRLLKIPGDPSIIQNMKAYDSLVNPTACALIGHNRYRTVGAVSAANAHPFCFDGLVGAHNGTLDDFARRKLEDHNEFGTDSEALFNNIDIHGVKETISEMTGAWALLWYDRYQNTVNFLRNEKRPLFFAFKKGKKVMYVASEAYMIRAAAARNGVELDEGKVWSVTEDRWIWWDIPDRNKSFGEMGYEKVEGKKYAPFVSQGYHPGTQSQLPLKDTKKSSDEKNKNDTPAASQANQDSTKKVSHSRGSKTGSSGEKQKGSGEKQEKTLAQQLTANDLEYFKAVEEGATAAKGGGKKSDNPFSKSSILSDAWREGFENYLESKEKKPTTIVGYKGEILNAYEWNLMVEKDCQWCRDPQEFGDDVIFIDKKEIVCKSCLDGSPELKQYLMMA